MTTRQVSVFLRELDARGVSALVNKHRQLLSAIFN